MLKLKNDKVFLDEKKIQKLQPKVDKIYEENIIDRKGLGNEFMDWLDYQENLDTKLIDEMKKVVNKLKDKNVKHLLVIGIGGSFLGAQAAIDFTKGKLAARDEVIFIGTDMSHSHFKQVENFLSDKEWAICVISKSGGTLEPSLAFNHFNDLLQKKHGDDANERVVAVTGNKGILNDLATSKGYKTFEIPDGIGGRFSVMTPVGLFPMIFANIDVLKVIDGANQAKKDLSSSNLSNNSAFKYAAIRYLLNKKSKISHEIFVSYDFDLDMMGEWFKQLFAESEGKDGKGIFPLSVSYSRDLHSLGQIIQEGPKTFFETILWINEEISNEDKIYPKHDDNDAYKLNYLVNTSVDEINKKAFDGVTDAHYHEGRISNLIIELEGKTESSLGYLFYWYFLAVTMSGYLLGINPFNQPGVEIYKKNMNENLKK